MHQASPEVSLTGSEMAQDFPSLSAVQCLEGCSFLYVVWFLGASKVEDDFPVSLLLEPQGRFHRRLPSLLYELKSSLASGQFGQNYVFTLVFA